MVSLLMLVLPSLALTTKLNPQTGAHEWGIISWAIGCILVHALAAPDHRHGVDGGGMTNQIKKITVTVTFNASCPFILFLNFVINHVNIS
jgi:hypothetical protein